jgi:hypothetical protein
MKRNTSIHLIFNSSIEIFIKSVIKSYDVLVLCKELSYFCLWTCSFCFDWAFPALISRPSLSSTRINSFKLSSLVQITFLWWHHFLLSWVNVICILIHYCLPHDTLTNGILAWNGSYRMERPSTIFCGQTPNKWHLAAGPNLFCS